QLWSDMPSRRVALTAETCHHAFTCGSALTASSSRSRRRLPRVGTRTCALAIASRGGIASSTEARGPPSSGASALSGASASEGGGSPSDNRGLQQHSLSQAATRDRQRQAKQLGRALQDQQPGGQQ